MPLPTIEELTQYQNVRVEDLEVGDLDRYGSPISSISCEGLYEYTITWQSGSTLTATRGHVLRARRVGSADALVEQIRNAKVTYAWEPWEPTVQGVTVQRTAVLPAHVRNLGTIGRVLNALVGTAFQHPDGRYGASLRLGDPELLGPFDTLDQAKWVVDDRLLAAGWTLSNVPRPE